MSKHLTLVLAAGAALAFAGEANAADSGFCRAYAHAAVREVSHALDHGRCRDMAASQGDRWSTDWRVHYSWCRTVSRDQAASENDARHDMLQQCAWHDHDDGDDDYHDHDHYDHP